MKILEKMREDGFTFIEIIVTISVFSILALFIFHLSGFIINEIKSYRDKTAVAFLANQYIEIIRNLPYSYIGTIHGSTCDKPEGEICDLPDLAEPKYVEFNGVVYEIYYAISYVDDPADGTILEGNDPAPNDYKQVKVYVKNTKTGLVKEFSTFVAPKGIESLGNRGAILIKVFNAFGQPVENATVHIVNENFSPHFDVTRLTDKNGSWIEIGVKPDVNGYQIFVSKEGYSKDYTLPITQENPNPTKPNLTVLVGQVSEVSFSIDLLSSFTFYSLSRTCQPINEVGFKIRGEKLIGTSPNIYKFEKNYFSEEGGKIYPMSDNCFNEKCLEWDTYIGVPTGENYMVYGTIPAPPLSLYPNSSQEAKIILGPYSNYSMWVIVKDSANDLPIEGAEVFLEGSVNKGPLITGGSVWVQSDWSEDSESYNISTEEIPYGLRLKKIGENYVNEGWLISSTFDTGTDQTVYVNLNWEPISQVEGTEVKFQIATNNDNETWNFIGPDGTENSYYTSSGTAILNLHNNQRYIRYKVFLSTTNPQISPVITNINLNYISGCYTPGQVIFTNLLYDNGGGYTIKVSKEGYQTQIIEGLSVTGHSLLEVSLVPNL